jgi:hypothetical protein
MQGAGAPAAEAAGARPAPAETPAETGPRSRDTLRNRERGER